jgi:hypothetical protein
MTKTEITEAIPVIAEDRRNPPRDWHEAKDGTLACPHRDLSVCPTCDAENVEALNVVGAHFWVPDANQRAEIVGA